MTLTPARLRPALKALFALEVAAVTAASLVSPAALPEVGFSWSDKAGHVLAYAVAAATGLAAFRRRWALAGGLIALGLVLEAIQGLATQQRSAEIGDAIANTVGVAAAFVIWSLIGGRRAG